MSASYQFAVLRAVPHVYLGAFVNVGVIVHARTEEFLDVRLLRDEELLRCCVPEVDLELLLRYLDSYTAICRGEERGGPVALLPTSERFHWLTAPRSDVLQCSPVHSGVADDLPATLAELYRTFVAEPAERLRGV